MPLALPHLNQMSRQVGEEYCVLWSCCVHLRLLENMEAETAFPVLMMGRRGGSEVVRHASGTMSTFWS